MQGSRKPKRDARNITARRLAFGACHAVRIALLSLLIITGVAHSQESHTYDARGRRDPFTPLVGATTRSNVSIGDIMGIEDVNLQGLASGAHGEEIAIMNGEMIREGQTIGRVTVKEISGGEIVILIDEEVYTVSIREEKLL